MQILKGMETLFVYWDGTISRIFYPEKEMQSIWYDLLLFFWLHQWGTWDLGSMSRDLTHASCSGITEA